MLGLRMPTGSKDDCSVSVETTHHFEAKTTDSRLKVGLFSIHHQSNAVGSGMLDEKCVNEKMNVMCPFEGLSLELSTLHSGSLIFFTPLHPCAGNVDQSNIVAQSSFPRSYQSLPLAT
ncbi:unnamed protein product [Protopolystoma xenopodis]|uniref:Uncharacterized protein n=1 Tax=Protopolystoma xenopodis TaxID=117903 RepID=A0A3S5AX20_9PLAT|nr:unnamed protein product [Protopolystoma xenopodis]